jgi:alpha-tubulin suppressor-like RCC1 family protein
MKDIENTKKEAPLKESPFLGLTGMGGGVASLMWHHAAGVETGGLWVWGSAGSGVYGRNSANPNDRRSSPVQVGTDTDWSTLSNSAQGAGGNHNNFRGKSDGTLWATGSPREDGGSTEYGLLGLNDNILRSSPTQIPGEWTGAVANGRSIKLATKKDGTLWSWGYGERGTLGLNTPTYTRRSSPTQIPGTWAITEGAVAAAQYTSFGIKADGTLWTWGYNEKGLMAVNQPQYYRRSSPVQVGTDSTWNTIMGDTWSSVIATKTDGTFWSWGYNGNGNLGQNQASAQLSHTSSPVQVGTDTNWSGGMNIANRGILATKTDGTMWAWGYNGAGVLGISEPGAPNQRSSPTQLPGTTWKTEMDSIGSTAYGRAAVKTDGTLWTWGQNEVGQLGLNNKTDYSSPKQVPGTTWIAVGGSTQSKGFQAIRK